MSYLSATTKSGDSKLDTDHLFVVLHMRMPMWCAFAWYSLQASSLLQLSKMDTW